MSPSDRTARATALPGEKFATHARQRLAAATRALLDAVLTCDVTDDELLAAAERADEITRALRAASEERAAPGSSEPGSSEWGTRERGPDDYLPRSPFVGVGSPLAPPFDYEAGGGRFVARGEFGAAHQGPPGYAHGGWVALAFDEALGMANAIAGLPCLTGRLTIRYRRPTPLHTPLVLEAHTQRVEGRRITTVGTLRDGDTLTAEAEGLFVMLGAERALEYFGERPSTLEPTDPLP